MNGSVYRIYGLSPNVSAPGLSRSFCLGDTDTVRIFFVAGKAGLLISQAPEAKPSRAGERMTEDEPIVGMYDLLEVLEAVIKAAEPDKRAELAATVDAYQESFPDEFFWAIGAQAPTLLSHLMTSIDISCRPEAQSKPRTPIGLVSRKPDSK